MKKTITVNLNGRVFTMDEDAYRLLDNYLNNLRIYFRKEEGASEIIADFEARIEELLSEKTRSGYQVITIEAVEEVIARVGKPADFADREESSEEEKQTPFTESKETKKKFYRNVDDKMFGGVCSGISAYFGWDVLPVRIVFIVLIFATSLWIIPPYLLAWILFPGAYTAEQKLRMRGKPITVENIGKTVAAEVEQIVTKESKGCIAGFIDLFVGLMKVFMIGVGFLVGIILLFVLIVVLFAVLFGVGSGFFDDFPSFLIVNNPVLTSIAFLLVICIPIIALIYSFISYLGKLKSLHISVKLGFLFIWILAFILLIFSGFRINKNYRFWNRNWNWEYKSDHQMIRGNGILSGKTYIMEEPVVYVEIGKYLNANLQIEQIQSDTASIIINGDENLIDQVKYNINNGRLVLSSNNPLRSENNLIISLQTKDLKGVRLNNAGNIKLNDAFACEELDIQISGPGKFQANSLSVQSLTVNSEGIASVVLSGKASKARFDLSGTGKIDAFQLESDTVYAYVKGVGSILCNPVVYLGGNLNGIGKITYKDEPKIKNISSAGIGKIGKE